MLKDILIHFSAHDGKKRKKSEKVFHSCFRRNRNGTNRVNEKKQCFCPTSQPFWKQTEDVPARVRTRLQEQNQELVKRGDFNRHLRQKGRDNIKRWLVTDFSEVHLLEELESFFDAH